MGERKKLSEKELIQVNQAIFSLRNVYESRLREESGDAGPSIAEMGVIMVLGQVGSVNSRSLARMMDITPGTVSQYVGRLERGGFLTQSREEGDRRSWLLALTAAGEELYREAFKGAVSYTRDLLSPLSDEEQRVLHGLLLKASRGNGYEWQ
jgi:DNA-binding MarR family transcriptional regulator